MSDDNGAGVEWEPSFSVGEDGTATFEVAQGDSRNMSQKDMAGLINKGLGFDGNAQKHAATEKELQGKYEALNKEHTGYTSVFGSIVTKLQNAGLEGDALDKAIERMSSAIDTKPTADDDNWFGDDAPAKDALTPDAVRDLIKGALTEHDESTKTTAKIFSTIKGKMTELGVPEALHSLIEDQALKGATSVDELPGSVEKIWNTMREANKEFATAETAKLDAAKHASGKNISKAGQVATSGDDPRAKAALGSKDNREYLAERFIARSTR